MRDIAEPLAGTTRPLRSATYLLRFTPEEKAELEQKVRLAAAMGRTPLTLADALRMGVASYLDGLITELQDSPNTEGPEDGGLART